MLRCPWLLGIWGCLVCVCLAGEAWAQAANRRPDAIFVMNADGTGWELFFKLPQMGAHGSPSVSRDGQWLAYDGWFSSAGQSFSDSHVMVVSQKRDQVILLGPGAMPNFGSDNTRMACSFNAGEVRGVGILTLSTDERKSIDPRGWGAQWSPDGKHIAYYSGTTLMLYDVESEESREHYKLEGYTSLCWNSGWSGDSQRLYITARLPENERALVSVNVDEEPVELTEHFRGKGLGERISLHPKEPKLLFQMYSPEAKMTQIYQLAVDQKDAEPVRLPGQPDSCRNTDATWSHDGTRIFASSAGAPAEQ